MTFHRAVLRVAPTAGPSPSATQSYAVIEADKQLDVGAAARSVHVGWTFHDGGANVPLQTNKTLVVDARDLSGVASVAVDDPRCATAGQVLTCVGKVPDVTHAKIGSRTEPRRARTAPAANASSGSATPKRGPSHLVTGTTSAPCHAASPPGRAGCSRCG